MGARANVPDDYAETVSLGRARAALEARNENLKECVEHLLAQREAAWSHR